MQVQEKMAQASAASEERELAAAVHARREAKLLATAQLFEVQYRSEVDRLQKLYVHDMEVRMQLQPRLPCMHKSYPFQCTATQCMQVCTSGQPMP